MSAQPAAAAFFGIAGRNWPDDSNPSTLKLSVTDMLDVTCNLGCT
jgi:hypothetical protein